MKASNIWHNADIAFHNHLFSFYIQNWMSVVLNIPEKSEFGHFFIRDYLLMVLYNLQKQPDISVHSECWCSERLTHLPKVPQLGHSGTEGNYSLWLRPAPLAQSFQAQQTLPDGSSLGIRMPPAAPGWEGCKATRSFLIQPPHLPSGNESSGLWKAFLDIRCYYSSCLPQGKCIRCGSLQRVREDWKGARAEDSYPKPWRWDQDGITIPYSCASASLTKDLIRDCALWECWAIN